MQHRTLYRHGKCIHVVCKHCQKGASAAKWLCECSIAWIACAHCRPLGSYVYLCASKGSLPPLILGPLPPPPFPLPRQCAFLRVFGVGANVGILWPVIEPSARLRGGGPRRMDLGPACLLRRAAASSVSEETQVTPPAGLMLLGPLLRLLLLCLPLLFLPPVVALVVPPRSREREPEAAAP